MLNELCTVFKQIMILQNIVRSFHDVNYLSTLSRLSKTWKLRRIFETWTTCENFQTIETFQDLEIFEKCF